MSEIEIKTEFVVEGLSFSSRKEAEEHLAFVKLHRNVAKKLKTVGYSANADELIGHILNHIISDRVEVRKILNGISGWEDNKIESNPQAQEAIKRMIEGQQWRGPPQDTIPPTIVPMMEPPPGTIFYRDAGSQDWASGSSRFSEHG